MVKKNEDKQRLALRYYLIGLNATEVGKLTGYSPRTIQAFARVGKWRILRSGCVPETSAQVLRMAQRGHTRKIIAKHFGRSLSWVATEIRKGKLKKVATR